MKRNIAKYFSFCWCESFYLMTMLLNIRRLMIPPLQQVIKEIFTVDPVSGFPKEILQYFLSRMVIPRLKRGLNLICCNLELQMVCKTPQRYLMI